MERILIRLGCCLVLIFLSNCNDPRASKLQIDSFSDIPDEIGAGCFFSFEEDRLQNKYVFVHDMAEIAFIKVNGKLQRLKFINTLRTNDSSIIDRFQNSEYELTLETIKHGKVDYVTLQKGLLRLKHKSGKEILIKITGECGC